VCLGLLGLVSVAFAVLVAASAVFVAPVAALVGLPFLVPAALLFYFAANHTEEPPDGAE
jgi:hypothetical protein